MMVSSKGFAKTARVKAASLGVRCLELTEVNSFDWMGIEFFVEFRKDFAPIDVHAFFVESAPMLPFTLFGKRGAEMTAAHFMGIIQQALTFPENLDELVGQIVPIEVRANTVDWTGAGADRVRHAVSHLILKSALTVVRNVKPVALHSYATESGKFDVATSQIEVGGKRGDIILVKAEDGTIRLALKIDE